jgi:DNA-binding response OmpR family regulator
MNPSNRILVVEDDGRLATLIQDYLQQQGFEVMIEARGDKAPGRILAERPDLLILDLMLPGRDGLSVCQQIRADYPGPILILTAREDDMDQVAGLEMGADDYVKKPVQPRVLLARIRALLRRFETPGPTQAAKANAAPPAKIQFGSLSINREAHAVELAGENILLTTNEFELLCVLAANAGKVLDRQTLYTDLRGIDYDGLDRAMDVMVSRLRKKMGDDANTPRRIKTVWGQGYLFVKDAW